MSPDDQTGLAPATVAVIDDNQTNLTLLRRVLARRPGLDVLYESDGQRGLDLVRQRNPHLVILDLHLPTLDGESILRALRSDPATAATPIVIVSGDATTQTKQRLRDAGATAYLEKPFKIQPLLDTINDLLPR